jgi:hypothetical protein
MGTDLCASTVPPPRKNQRLHNSAIWSMEFYIRVGGLPNRAEVNGSVSLQDLCVRFALRR